MGDGHDIMLHHLHICSYRSSYLIFLPKFRTHNMQRAIPYQTWASTGSSPTTASTGGSTSLHSQLGDSVNSVNSAENTTKNATSLLKFVLENAVIVFGRRGCCMCHVVKQLLLGLGVNPTIFCVDEEDEAAITDQLSKIVGVDGDHNNAQVQFPAVFIGGKLFGGLERVMATHISGELVPILREARALWL